MPIIYCDTQRLAYGIFEFTRSEFIGLAAIGEVQQKFEQLDNDRLRAAIVNVGLACRLLHDRNDDRPNTVAIVSDKDGKDTKFKGEHDALYSLLCPSSSEMNRKHRSLFGEYLKYLDRINELRTAANIKILLCPKDKLVGLSGQVYDG